MLQTSLDRGSLGESRVSALLRHLDRQWYRVLDNLFLRHKITGKTAQIDHIVVSIYGVFVIETKNSSGLVIGDSLDDSWVQWKDGHWVELYSPAYQNYGHVQTVKSLLWEEVPVYSIVCFTADTELVVDAKSLQVVTLDTLLDTIYSYKEMRLMLGQVDMIVDILQENALRGEEVLWEHRRRVYEAKLRYLDRRSSVVCPKCGRPAVRRPWDTKPRFCRDFPNCSLVLPAKMPSEEGVEDYA